MTKSKTEMTLNVVGMTVAVALGVVTGRLIIDLIYFVAAL